LIRIPNITEAQKLKWGKGRCSENHRESDFLKIDSSYDSSEFKRLEVEIDKMIDTEKFGFLLYAFSDLLFHDYNSFPKWKYVCMYGNMFLWMNLCIYLKKYINK
jgi:hypothetical protein